MSSPPPAGQLLAPDHPYWEKCARHQNKHTTRFVAHLFLCDGCAERLRRECFNDRPPMFEGLAIDGFCALCNRRQMVLLRQWFVCQICLGVVLAYPKTFAASQAVHNFWTTQIVRDFPNLRLEETEIVRLEPFIPGRRTQRRKSESVTFLDFAAFDVGLDDNPLAFHIEMKAGPGSIENMKQFQLDINDSNDVATVCNNSGIPAYIFHVQVGEEHAPPTRHSVARGMWWTDCFRLQEHLQNVKPRRGEEDKHAGYYCPGAFRVMDDFLEELRNRGYLALRERLAREPLPTR